jgi:predicted MPP superfamily phosphohydrolase
MIKRLALFLAIAVGLLACLGYWAATTNATQRKFLWHVTGWPKGATAVRLVLISDLHVVEPDMPTTRLAGIVQRINALRPDCVLIAGDLISDRLLSTRHVPFDEALAPLAALRPKIATMAVLGNHDHGRNGNDATAALRKYGVRVLSNDAARCGALAIGGIDDIYTGHDNIAATEIALKRVGGIRVMLTHSPDVFPQVSDARLTLAGHTHCGQISLPFYGPPAIPSKYGRRFACGVIRENGKFLIVTAGLGVSVVPIRWNAPSDFWIVTVGS